MYHITNKLILLPIVCKPDILWYILTIFHEKGAISIKRDEAVITLEASLILPLFTMAILCLLKLFILINCNNVIQDKIFFASQKVSRYQYIVEKFKSQEFENLVGEQDKEILTSGITIAYVLKNIQDNEVNKCMKESQVNSPVLNILESVIDKNGEGVNDIKVSYIALYNFFGYKYPMNMANRSYFKSWVGESLKESSKSKRQTVYITRTGKVYHLDKNCTYIKRNIESVSFGEIDRYRNNSGAKYYPCESCISGQKDENEYVYITKDGKRYHGNIDCNKLERNIIGIDIRDVGDRTKCSKCGG